MLCSRFEKASAGSSPARNRIAAFQCSAQKEIPVFADMQKCSGKSVTIVIHNFTKGIYFVVKTHKIPVAWFARKNRRDFILNAEDSVRIQLWNIDGDHSSQTQRHCPVVKKPASWKRPVVTGAMQMTFTSVQFLSSGPSHTEFSQLSNHDCDQMPRAHNVD